MLVCLRGSSSPWTWASGMAGTRDFKPAGFPPSIFGVASLIVLKLHYSLPQSWLHNLWSLVQNENVGALVQRAEKGYFPLFSWSFFQTYYGFFICCLISPSPGHGVTCRASVTLSQCDRWDSVHEMCTGRTVAGCYCMGARRGHPRTHSGEAGRLQGPGV